MLRYFHDYQPTDILNELFGNLAVYTMVKEGVIRNGEYVMLRLNFFMAIPDPIVISDRINTTLMIAGGSWISLLVYNGSFTFDSVKPSEMIRFPNRITAGCLS